MLTLITDRKQSDVDRAKQLIEKAKNIENLSSSELEEYLNGLKGCYNISDLNRVESAVQYISDLLNNLGYENKVNTKLWEFGETFTSEHVERYLQNIKNIRSAITVLSNVPEVPLSYKPYINANKIEEILYKINEIIINMTQNFIHCGVANCGQNRLWQQRFRRQNWLPVKYELTNLISDPSFENNQWSGANYSTVEKLFDSRSLYFPTGTTVIASIVIDRPIVGHKYYGRRYIKTNGNNQPADCRFEVYGGDGANLNWVYAWNNGNHQEWEFGSAIHEITAVGYAENVNTIIRCFNVNTTANTWIDGVMLIDLTDCFGEGKEPTKQWCDEHIPFFEGTQIIEVKENIKEG